MSQRLLKEVKVGDDVLYLYYHLKTKDVPICVEIVFYKPNDIWFLEKIMFDDMCTFFRELYI